MEKMLKNGGEDINDRRRKFRVEKKNGGDDIEENMKNDTKEDTKEETKNFGDEKE